MEQLDKPPERQEVPPEQLDEPPEKLGVPLEQLDEPQERQEVPPVALLWRRRRKLAGERRVDRPGARGRACPSHCSKSVLANEPNCEAKKKPMGSDVLLLELTVLICTEGEAAHETYKVRCKNTMGLQV
jgi:hypothetical protein